MRDWTRSEYGERVRHLAEMRRVSLNKLGAAAGLKSGLISRAAGKKGKASSHPDTTLRLAEAWGCSPAWLAFGVGQPGDAGPPSLEVDRYPHRAEAARVAREGGVDPAAVAAVLEEGYELVEDPPVLWWIHQIEARAILAPWRAKRKKRKRQTATS